MDEQERAVQLYQAGLLAKNYHPETQANILLEKSARLGNADAMCELIYSGVVPFNELTEWLKRAADNGNTKAFEALGNIYVEMVGGWYDSEAYDWFKRAVSYYEFLAEKGDAFAMKKLADLKISFLHDKWSAEGYVDFPKPPKIRKLYELAAAILKNLAEAGNVEAMIALADIYRPMVDGVIKPKKSKAIKYLTQAFELGSPDLKITACKMLADIYDREIIISGATDNFTKAVEWFERAAALGDFDSMCKLVELHKEAGNFTESEVWKRKADAAQAKVLSEVENVLQNL